METQRLESQLKFLLEIDRLKTILRRSYICGGLRKENSAEHCWHVAMMALLLAEHADQRVDRVRVMKMMLVHDIVEIDAGDAFIYDEHAVSRQEALEEKAAQRIFSLLPDDQRDELVGLWREFEAEETPEAKFAKAVDRLMPLLHNFQAHGKTWREHGLKKQQVVRVNRKIEAASKGLWAHARGIIEQACAQGFLTDEEEGQWS